MPFAATTQTHPEASRPTLRLSKGCARRRRNAPESSFRSRHARNLPASIPTHPDCTNTPSGTTFVLVANHRPGRIAIRLYSMRTATLCPGTTSVRYVQRRAEQACSYTASASTSDGLRGIAHPEAAKTHPEALEGRVQQRAYPNSPSRWNTPARISIPSPISSGELWL